MKVYLVRHGNAEPGANDKLRPLSQEGIAEVKKIAEFLKSQDCKVETIYHSLRLRAKQTAQIIHDRLKIKKMMIERPGLCPDDDVAAVADFVEQEKEDMMLVGHMPFMGHLVSLLVSGEENRNLVSFPTGGVAVLEKKHKEPWLIAAMIDPKMLE